MSEYPPFYRAWKLADVMSQQSSPSDDLRDWEETDQQLQQAVILDSCSASEHSEPSYLNPDRATSSVDNRLHQVEGVIKTPLNSAQPSISSLKNKLNSPIHWLPLEILTQIFRMVIYHLDLEVEDPEHLSYDHRAKFIYCKLYRLYGVCSAWKQVLLTQGTFWSLVPIVFPYYWWSSVRGARLSLERSMGAKLHLVVALTEPDTHRLVLDTLARFGSRVESVNFNCDFRPFLQEAIYALVKRENNVSDCLTSLSLFYNPNSDVRFFLQSAPQKEELRRVMELLQVLRLRRVEIPLRGLLFKNLTRLMLQDMSIGAMVDLEDILWALSSSSQLQLLEIISVRAHRNPPDTPLRSYDFPISLPSLQLLHLKGLAHNVLELILGSIASGSHHVTLNFSNVCLTERTHTNQTVAIDLHQSKLPNLKVDTLMMDSNFCGDGNHVVTTFLQLVPTATELFLNRVYLDPSVLQAVIVSKGPSTAGRDTVMPRFTKLRLAYCHFHDVSALVALQDVVASHPIVELGLGVGCLGGLEPITFIDLVHPPIQLDPYKQWFLNAVPKVVWLPGPTPISFHATESESDMWQL